MSERAESRGPGMSLEQIRVYARELQQLYRAEHQARQELEARTQALEQKLRELAALNRLSQANIRKSLEAQKAFQDLLAQLKSVVARAEAEAPKETPT